MCVGLFASITEKTSTAWKLDLLANPLCPNLRERDMLRKSLMDCGSWTSVSHLSITARCIVRTQMPTILGVRGRRPRAERKCFTSTQSDPADSLNGLAKQATVFGILADKPLASTPYIDSHLTQKLR